MRNKKQKTASKDLKISALKQSVSKSPISRLKIKFAILIGSFKRFFHEYRLPATASAIFFAMLLVFSTMRLLERTSTLALRNDPAADGGYSILLSGDSADQFNRESTDEPDNDTSDAVAATNSTQSTSNSFTIPSTSNPTNEGGTDQGDNGDLGGGDEGGGDEGGGDEGGGEDPPAPDPLVAEINSFNSNGATLQCANPKNPNRNNCSKTYSFSGSILATNGPGSVSYVWQSNIGQGNGSSSFLAETGTSLTTVNKEVSLSCKSNTNFTIQLAIVEPTLATSSTIDIKHNCDEI